MSAAMSVENFGRRIGVSRASAYRIVAAGQVALTNVGTGSRPRVRITEAALDAYLKSRTIKGVAA